MPLTHEVTVNAARFAAAVAWAAKWKAAKPAIPIHAGLELTAVANGLTIAAFDGDVAARVSVDTEGFTDVPGRAIVSGNLLAALAATLPAKGVVTLAGTDDGSITMSLGRWSASLPTFDEGDWPTMPVAPAPIGAIAGDAFAAAVAQVGAACGRDAKPMMFNLINLTLGADVTLTATDRYRVAQTRVPWTPAVEGASGEYATPIGATLIDAAAAFTGPGAVEIGCDGRVLGLTGSSRSLVMPLGDPGGEGWPIEVMTAQLDKTGEYDGFVDLDPATLVVPLKRAAIVRGKEGPVRLGIAPGVLTIASSEKDLKQEGNEEVEIVYDGPAVALAVNPNYLADALHTAPGDKVTLRFSTANTARAPMAVTSPADPHWRHAVVPVIQR